MSEDRTGIQRLGCGSELQGIILRPTLQEKLEQVLKKSGKTRDEVLKEVLERGIEGVWKSYYPFSDDLNLSDGE